MIEVGNSSDSNRLPSNDNIISELFDDLLWANSICEQCGQNHGYQPNFEGVKTSMDIIPQLIGRWCTE